MADPIDKFEVTLGLDRKLLRSGGGPRSLRIIGEGLVATHPLPEEGELLIGRSEAAQVCIEDPSVSRRHAILRVGPPLTVEDLGSANGTKAGGRRLLPGEVAEVAEGEVIDLGSVMLVVQSKPAAPEEPVREVQDGTMRQLHRLVERVAAASISVLLMGETGVGKEVMAETVHRLSPRAKKAFLRLNCAALSESLLESELFGHEKGAFTGADQAKPGLLDTADGGTVFLDEVGELPLALQVKLLRVLEERQVLRVGGLKPRPIDVRFVSATNRDLEAEVDKGTFRRDLYFRLNGISLVIPPLRQRTREIEELARTFIAQASKATGRQERPRLSPEALAALLRHPWPGNIRELRNVIERAVLLCTGDELLPEHLPLAQRGPPASAPPPVKREGRPLGEGPEATTGSGLKRELAALERQRILDALEQCAGNQTRAAKLLGISRRTLLNRLEEYGLPRPRKS